MSVCRYEAVGSNEMLASQILTVVKIWLGNCSSEGPRQCLGEDSALMEVSYTVVSLLQASSLIALPAGEKAEPVG